MPVSDTNDAFNISFKRWDKDVLPQKVLVIRFQALGDTVITLPYLQRLKRQYPGIKIHFFTRVEVSAIPKSINIFDEVITLHGGRNAKLQFLLALLKLPYLWRQRYDIVVDLQNNKISAWVRKCMRAKAWAEFDKYSSASAALRTKATLESVGFTNLHPDTQFTIACDWQKLLEKNGRKNGHSLVVLNPAGAFPSRHWPIDFYIGFAKLWLEQVNVNTQFILLLLPALQSKSDQIADALGDACINLTGKANQVEAFTILKQCSFVLTEDSGLMHMSWVQGIPTLALFSSSRKDWSAPQGEWSLCLDSSDLECGPCKLEICKFGDNRCLLRYSPDFVLLKARQLLKLREAQYVQRPE
jgi:heptosyltransferase-2